MNLVKNTVSNSYYPKGMMTIGQLLQQYEGKDSLAVYFTPGAKKPLWTGMVKYFPKRWYEATVEKERVAKDYSCGDSFKVIELYLNR